jgi:hypothetical protein
MYVKDLFNLLINKKKKPLNTDFEIKNERQDCKIGTVWEGTCGRGEGEWRR